MPRALRALRATLSCLFAIVAAWSPASSARAQTTDVIRGRIIAPDSSPIANARVTVTSVGGNVSRTARTDAQGRYTVTFPGGDGDYFIAIAAIGFSAKRFELKRTAEQEILIGDAKLQPAATTLDAVEVLAPRNRVRRTEATPDISGTERPVGGDLTAVPADQWGDLAAMAASLPGVSLVPGQDGGANGYSVLGLGADQNNATLNGLGFGGAGLPRDAAISSALSTSPYDVSRGGFSGGQTQLRTRPGSNFMSRGSSFNLDAPPLQYTDPAARQLGQRFTNASWGGLLSGPLVVDKAFYSVSYQLGRRLNDFRTVVNTDAAGLAAAGVSADSARRFLQVLGGLGVPATRAGLPTDRTFDNASVLATVDLMPPSSTSGTAVNLTVNGSWNRQEPLSFAATEVPTASGRRDSWRGGVQGRHSAYLSGILTETSAGVQVSDAEATPYLLGPSGRVRVNSVFDDGANALATLAFGGNPFFNSRQRTSGAEVLNQLSWFSRNNRHRLKLTSELRTESWNNDVAQNLYGTFLYNSLADLEGNRPVSYVRERARRVQDVQQINGAVSLGDAWRVTPTLQVQAGVRADAQRFLTAPLGNAALDSLYGMDNRSTPSRVYWSPRVGFSWTVGQAPQVSAFDGAFRAPAAVIRGGFGVFQNMFASPGLGGALVNTGLASGQQQLTCTGAAVPVPDWSGWLASPDAVPQQCLGGGGVFANAAPNVSAFARDFQAPRSVRGNLQWSGAVLGNRFQFTADATWSENRFQPGQVDRNVRDSVQFTLADEAGRPVFVRPTSIFAANGAIASRDAIVSPRFNRVQELRSDFTSTTRQLTLSLAPTRYSQQWSWGVSYVLSRFDDAVPGFQSTVGSPFAVDRARSAGDSRHQVVLNLSYNLFDAVRISWFSSFRSGTPYTPIVGGDINGDGYTNDRAFIPDPTTVADPAVAAGLRALLATGAPGARDCLSRQVGQLAARSSCEGPWTANATLSIGLNPVKVGLPYRMSLSFQLANPLGAADLMVNGPNRLRGWGQPAAPDPTLLYVRGFDPATQRFRYEVNERFGATSPARTAIRAPVTLTALARFDFAPTRERQQLVQSLDRGRTVPGERTPEFMLRALYAQGGMQNPFAQLLRQQDTLQLTADQADSIATVNRWYAIRLDSLWTPLTRQFATLGDRYDRADVLDRYQRAREATVDLLRRVAPPVRQLLTAEQQRRLPAAIAAYLDPRFLASIRPGTVSFTGGGLSAGGGAPSAAPLMGGGGGAQIIFR